MVVVAWYALVGVGKVLSPITCGMSAIGSQINRNLAALE